MAEVLKVDVITLFPQMLAGFLGESMMKRASEAGLVEFRLINPRDFTTDKHNTTDDRPFGGGPGMLMKPEPLFAAVESVHTPQSHVILMTPSGKTFEQADARRLSIVHSHLIFICGHYEGVDERVREALVDEEISIGDYVLTNGVLSAVVIIDAVARLRPGVLGGGEIATEDESFSSGLLEHPQYTRPPEFRGMKVPEILFSGDHGKIAQWRHDQAVQRTMERRIDLLENERENSKNNP
ncbi:tRNA (guanosine(37)-N1)-methyltransferase TrmD [Pontiella sulfatireligans]|uniref:tRNA (guanine-N(1)-)-methyltransferase n=1 Tax=Pontiella sulfatireligans TaxID=2750658 RepID=A0A6C2UGY4_9BACT|nr:tRNA (guanosine(37)-N1)-methyltransferase TrmD [Pontiella sulfatireligans]VGO18466.1 tRNA (guanine-N(1)-)-methyltransferase [Pontiella sulfatireligans]